MKNVITNKECSESETKIAPSKNIIYKSRIFSFSKLVGIAFIIQAVVQFTGMLVAFYIVRKLTIQEYALYTVANNMLVMLNILSDSGVSTGAYALGAKVWTDKIKLGRVMSTAIAFRNKFSLLALAIGIPVTIYLLREQQASWESLILISIAFIPAFKSQLTDNLYEVVSKLHQDISKLQWNQLFVALFRLFLSGISLIFFPFAWIALLANGVPRLIGNFQLRKIVDKRAMITKDVDEEANKEIKKIVKRTFPGSLYFAFSGQISLFILANMGKASNVAEWGALTRYSVIFTLLSTVFAMVIIPRYARMENNAKKLFFAAHKILAVQFILGLLVVVAGYLLSDFLLNILGKGYEKLGLELVVVLFSGLIGVVRGTVLAFSIRRGWIINPFLDVALNVFPLILFAWLFTFDSLLSVLLFGLCVNLFVVIASYIVYLFQLKKYSN